MRRFSSMLFLLILIALAVGCSGGGGNPAQPGIQNENPDLTSQDPNDSRQGEDLQLTGINPDGFNLSDNSHFFWGLYQATIDPVAETIEVIPLREASLHINILKIIEPNGQYGWFKLASGFTWNTNHTELDFDMSLTNPLFSMDQYSAFDMKAIIITKGTLGGFSNTAFGLSSLSEMCLKNADGYTRWWNPTEFVGNTFFSYRDGALGFKDAVVDLTSTLNGYKYYADGLNKDAPLSDLNISNRGFFRAGSTNIRHFKFWLPTLPDSLVFNYAIDANWAPPTVEPPVDFPGDFPPAANQAEPWFVTASETLNQLYYEPTTGNSGGRIVLAIKVYDWHSPLPVTEPGGTIQRVVGEWPGVFGPTEGTYVSDMGDYAIYELTLTPLPGMITNNDDLEYMIWVEDAEEPGYNGILPGEKVVSAALFTTTVGVTPPNLAPVITSGVDGNAGPGLTLETYSVTASDADGDPLQYSWTVSGTPISNDPGNGDGTIDINWSSYGINTYTISCSVTDSVNPPVDATDLEVMVGNTNPTVGAVTGKTNVSSLDTAALYNAQPIGDIDIGQVLTAHWSIVLTGDTPDYSILALPDLSTAINWSGYGDGDYDVNIQVSDGFALVEGTLLTVTKYDNNSPLAGAVTGPTTVYHSDTASGYSATMSDPEGDPLTVLWSVVPEGNATDYTIPGAEGNPLIVDWSTYPALGLYDVNVQVDDGLNPPVEGTSLTVSLENTAPSISTCNGPIDVDSTSTAAHYTIIYGDIDSVQTLTVLWSVVGDGLPADYSLASNPDGSLDYNWALKPIGNYDVSVQVSDGIATATCGPINVTKHNLPPSAGQCAGKSPVNGNDTNTPYTCPISDPDVFQALTILWSVVPQGNAPDYVIPDIGSGQVSINWSSYGLGLYEVNVRVSDGIDTVEGNAKIVERINTNPVVGAVAGPASVNCTNTAAHYTAPISDPDPGQILTAMWSIVTTGSPASYIIPSNPDKSLDVDWSTYPVGGYDVNVQVSDGLATVTGTLLLVTRSNTPPVAGAVTGPTMAIASEILNYYLSPGASDCDIAQVLSFTWSVVPQGNPASYTLPTVDDNIDIDWSVYGTGLWRIGCRVYDGVVYSYSTTLDVTVALCANTDAHYFDGNIQPVGYSIAGMSILPRADVSFLESGIPGLTQNKALVQIDLSHLGLFDADSDASPTVPLINKYSLLKNDNVLSIDSDPTNLDPSPQGRVLLITQQDPQQIKVMSSNTLVGNPFIDYLNSGSLNKTWTAIDFASNGDFWAIMRDTTSGPAAFTLRLFKRQAFVNPGDKTYLEDTTAILNITGKVSTQDDIFDIAVNYSTRDIYVFEAGTSGRGSIHVYAPNIGAPPTFVESITDIFSQTIDYSIPGLTGFNGFAMWGDIEIDHLNSGVEKCRILVYARLADSSAELRRLNKDFLLLDTQAYSTAATSFSINVNPSEGTRNLIMPTSTNLQWWATPVAW
ncbi:MAG: hypothetical protein NTY09_14595 [bacterium]|nr:hypothetical protein [bacterium]